MKRNLELTCPFCGINKVQHNHKKFIGMEHVPPKCIFTNVLKKDLITIPSCHKCNNSTSQMDEKFIYHLSIYLGIDTKAKQHLWNKSRSLLKKKPNWRTDILQNTSQLYLPYYQGYGRQTKLDARIIKTVAEKIIRGLHWYFTETVLPPDIKLTIELLKQGTDVEALDKSISILLNNGKILSKCEGQFEVIYNIATDSNHASVWLIKFYGENVILGIVTP